MVPRFVHKLVFVLAILGLASIGRSQGLAATPELRFSEPMPEVAIWAKANGWTLGVWQWAEGRSGMVLGDEVVVLVELTKMKKRQQWLIRLRAVEMNDGERKKHPVKKATLHVISGRAHELVLTSCAINTVVVGPFTAGQNERQPSEKFGRVVVGSEMLQLGFYGLGPWFTKLHNIKVRSTPEERIVFDKNWWSFGESHPAEQIAVGQRLASLYGVTSEEESIYYWWWGGLINFLNVIMKTPGMQDLFFETSAFSRPETLWDFALGRSINIYFTAQEGASMVGEKWGMGSGQQVRTLPHMAYLFGKPAVRFQLAVVEPRPPLVNTAGVIGLAAMRPDRDDVHVMLRVLSTTPAAVKTAIP